MKLTETDNIFKAEGTVECGSCKGKGLYFGMAERNGARVVCHSCGGKGSIELSISWIKFKGRKKDKDAKRVYTNGMGYMITDKDVTTKEGRFMPFSKYGCSYEEWLNGATPKPLEFLGCPYQETNQDLQCNDVNGLYKTRCNKNIGFGRISDCKLYPEKSKCWEIYNK